MGKCFGFGLPGKIKRKIGLKAFSAGCVAKDLGPQIL